MSQEVLKRRIPSECGSRPLPMSSGQAQFLCVAAHCNARFSDVIYICFFTMLLPEGLQQRKEIFVELRKEEIRPVHRKLQLGFRAIRGVHLDSSRQREHRTGAVRFSELLQCLRKVEVLTFGEKQC